MNNEMQTHVGCAMSLFNNGSWRAALFACNYAFTNFIGRRVYRSGATASQCVSGRDATFRNLCTVNEPINVNDWRRSFNQTYTTMAIIEY